MPKRARIKRVAINVIGVYFVIVGLLSIAPVLASGPATPGSILTMENIVNGLLAVVGYFLIKEDRSVARLFTYYDDINQRLAKIEGKCENADC